MADETKRVDVIMGPYRGNLLTMPTAEADAAINAHWARDPFSGVEYGTGHDPLSDEERASALEASRTWAQAQWAGFTQEPPPDPPVTRAKEEKRDMKPDEPAAKYTTRDKR